MGGAVAIVIVLLLFPILALIGMTFIAAGLGYTLNRDGEERNADSELLDVNY